MKVKDAILLFGDKEIFAIQLGSLDNPEKIKLCFWVQGKKLGSFTKGGELKYSIKSYESFSMNHIMYYHPDFDDMTPTGIKKYFVDEMFTLMNSNKKEKQEEYEKRGQFLLFFGNQFTNDGSFMKVLYKENKVIFIYEPPRKEAKKYITSFSIFCKTFEEYIKFCMENELV